MLYILILFIRILYSKENAVILILCRNREMNDINKSIKNFEKRFNKKYKYPYVFLNDEEFTNEFKETLSQTCENRVKFGLVDKKVWEKPDWIDEVRMRGGWEEMKRAGVPYADMESYHNMCRFFSRSFYKHELVKSYDYYWRIEPGVRFRCDIEGDPFEYMATNGKKYGFVITIREYMASIPTLMRTTASYLKRSYASRAMSKVISKTISNNTLGGSDGSKEGSPEKEVSTPSSTLSSTPLSFLFEPGGSYNGCHFWSNFEIGAFDWLRSEAYELYVDTLEQTGGFYYERWGDAPVHSLAAALLLDKSQIHFFDNIGYTHEPFTHCPVNGKNCDCNPKDSIDYAPNSCLTKYKDDIKVL